MELKGKMRHACHLRYESQLIATVQNEAFQLISKQVFHFLVSNI